LEISTTGVFAFEYAFSARRSSLVHGFGFLIFLAVFAIKAPVFNDHPRNIEKFELRINPAVIYAAMSLVDDTSEMKTKGASAMHK
jgi:hypothetical protein